LVLAVPQSEPVVSTFTGTVATPVALRPYIESVAQPEPSYALNPRNVSRSAERTSPENEKPPLAATAPMAAAEVPLVDPFTSGPPGNVAEGVTLRSPAEMARAKLFAWDGDPASVEAWRAAGFQPVVLSSLDLVPSLQTGMIDCLPNLPVYVLATRIFEKARFMIDVPWGQVVGATVIAKRRWDRIPPELRPRLLELAREVGARVDADARSADAEAVSAMRSQGLQVVEVEKRAWRAAAESGWPHIRGQVVPADLFDEVKRYRDEYRAGVVATRAH
jgi:Bacterial extracellular solute-binding protein, family 7